MSATDSNVTKNFIYNVAYQVLFMLTPLITAPYLSRVLGADGVGSFSYTYNIANYFVLVAMLGINNHGCRVIARAGDDIQARSKAFHEVHTVQLISSGVALLLYVAYIVFVPSDAAGKTLASIWFVYIISAVFDINWLFFGLEKFRITVTRNVLIKLATVCLMFVVVRDSGDLAVYTLLYASSLLLSQLVLWPFARKLVVRYRPKARDVWRQFKNCLVLFIPVISISLYTSANTLILGTFGSMADVGVYDYASRFIGIPAALINSLGTVMMPRMIVVNSRAEDEGARYLRLSMGVVMLLLGAFAFGLVGISHNLSTVFLGRGFEDCEYVLNILVLALPFIAWANVLRTQYLIPCNRDRSYILSVVSGAVINVVLALLLVRPAGAFGMAISYAIAQAVVCLVQTASVRRELPFASYFKEGVPFLVLGLVMAMVTHASESFLPTDMAGLVLEIFIGAMCYSALVIVMSRVSNNETAQTAYGMVVGVVRKVMGRNR